MPFDYFGASFIYVLHRKHNFSVMELNTYYKQWYCIPLIITFCSGYCNQSFWVLDKAVGMVVILLSTWDKICINVDTNERKMAKRKRSSSRPRVERSANVEKSEKSEKKTAAEKLDSREKESIKRKRRKGSSVCPEV